MKEMTLTQSELRRQFYYDMDTGIFTYKVGNRQKYVGDTAGTKSRKGYMVLNVNGKGYLLSRLAFLYVSGYLPENLVDHKNRVKDDNRWSNLREISNSCNLLNSKTSVSNTSGVKGVSYMEGRMKWRSYITIRKRTVSLYYGPSFTDAVIHRYRGEKANSCSLNSSAEKYLLGRGLI